MSIFGTLRYLVLVLIVSLATSAQAAAAGCQQSWPAWNAFKKNLISKEGRVIDRRAEDLRSTSEGQAYALFFALVANDRETFDRLLAWTETNLAQGDLTAHLPSWQWGKADDGGGVVLDENSASDADLWMAYALGEAGRLWNDRRYVALASLMANRMLNEETAAVPKLGLVLLPGSAGFSPGAASVRLNPSYVPLQLMRWFVEHGKDPRWASLLDSSRQSIIGSAPKGYAPDWTLYDYSRGFRPEPGAVGSYDAIRVYLWAGMLNRDDADRQLLIDTLRPMATRVEKTGAPPQSIDILTGAADMPGSSGFSAAMLPLLQAAGLDNAVESQRQRIEAQPIAEDHYYDQVLSLYALGWRDNLYRFDPKGNLAPRWTTSCQ